MKIRCSGNRRSAEPGGANSQHNGEALRDIPRIAQEARRLVEAERIQGHFRLGYPNWRRRPIGGVVICAERDRKPRDRSVAQRLQLLVVRSRLYVVMADPQGGGVRDLNRVLPVAAALAE